MSFEKMQLLGPSMTFLEQMISVLLSGENNRKYWKQAMESNEKVAFSFMMEPLFHHAPINVLNKSPGNN
jgi:hypothetical protein